MTPACAGAGCEAVECSFGGDAFSVDAEAECSILDIEIEVFADLVFADHFADANVTPRTISEGAAQGA